MWKLWLIKNLWKINLLIGTFGIIFAIIYGVLS